MLGGLAPRYRSDRRGAAKYTTYYVIFKALNTASPSDKLVMEDLLLSYYWC